MGEDGGGGCEWLMRGQGKMARLAVVDAVGVVQGCHTRPLLISFSYSGSGTQLYTIHKKNYRKFI